MADSIGLQVLKAMEARLKVASVQIDGQTFTPPTGLVVQRERVALVTAVAVKDGPLILIDSNGERPTVRKHYKSKMLIRTMEALVTVLVDASALPTSDALDPATNWLISAFQSDPTLGGIAHWMNEEGRDDNTSTFDNSAVVVGVREMKWHIEFHSRTEIPTARS